MEMKYDIDCFAPHVKKHVEVLLSASYVGLCNKRLQVMNPASSSPPYMADAKCDRFKLVIPYAGVSVECVVFFQAAAPQVAPDFIFSDSRFFPPIHEIETLRKWDVNKSDGLLQVITAVLQCYKKKQIMVLERYDLLSYEYLSLFQLQDFDENDVEIFVPTEQDNPVTFLIRLHIEFNVLLADLLQGHSDSDPTLLLITFSSRETNRCTQKLYLATDVEAALGIDESFRLSGPVTEHSLSQYIGALETDLRNKAEIAASRYERRKMYFAKFLSHFEHFVVEYDMLLFTNLVLLLEEGDFHFLLEISLPDSFPTGTPSLIFRSIYHTHLGRPTAVAIDTYPYSSSWSLQKVLKETIKFIKDYVPLFKQDSTPNFYDEISDDEEEYPMPPKRPRE